MKYGGVKFRNLVPPVKINRFVTALPLDKRDSLFEIASELHEAGLIDVLNGRTHSTIDKDTLADQMPNTESKPQNQKGAKRHLNEKLTLPQKK